MSELVKELTNEVGDIPFIFPTPALSGSGDKGMFSAFTVHISIRHPID